MPPGISADRLTDATAPGRWGLGRLGPIVLALWLCLDLVLRFLPAAWFGPHPVDLATARPSRQSSFTPSFNKVFHNWEGDGAKEANLPPTERRTPYRISVDSLGFRRNPFASATDSPDVLFLLGRSFLLGAALSDEETLPAAFTVASGLEAYNGHGLNRPEQLDWLLGRLPGRPWLAVLVLIEDDSLIRPQNQVVHSLPLGNWVDRTARASWRRWSTSPLERLCRRLIRSVSDDQILPNEGLRGGRQLRLPDGRPMLFRLYEVRTAQKGRTAKDAERLGNYAAWWRDELASRGIDTWVLLLPSRYTVYGPWLESGEARKSIIGIEEYIYELDRQIRGRGIRTLNALPIYRASVEEQLKTGELLFYREDNHWNPRGVELIAGVLSDSILGTRRRTDTLPKSTVAPNPTH
ncbi:MAG: alginate O-acetyltransferase AlgX-related protein [Gemmatimonadales bacterium]